MFQPSTIQRNTTKKQHNWTTNNNSRNSSHEPIRDLQTLYINQSEPFKLFTSTNQPHYKSARFCQVILSSVTIKLFLSTNRIPRSSCVSTNQTLQFCQCKDPITIRQIISAFQTTQAHCTKIQIFRQSRHNVPKFSVADSALTLNQKSVC